GVRHDRAWLQVLGDIAEHLPHRLDRCRHDDDVRRAHRLAERPLGTVDAAHLAGLVLPRNILVEADNAQRILVLAGPAPQRQPYRAADQPESDDGYLLCHGRCSLERGGMVLSLLLLVLGDVDLANPAYQSLLGSELHPALAVVR